jgi:hypothetical protein
MVIAFYPGAGGNRYLRMLTNQLWSELGQTYDFKVKNQHFRNRYLLHDKVYGTNNNQYTLTHCMNSYHIAKFFPSDSITFIKGDLKKCLQREWALAGHDRYKLEQPTKVLDRIEHYIAYKDNQWPEIHTLKELQDLPKVIMEEVNKDFEKVSQGNLQKSKTLQSVTNDLIVKANSAYETIKWHLEFYNDYKLDFSKNCETIVDIENDDTEFANVMRAELKLYSSEIFDEIWRTFNVDS